MYFIGDVHGKTERLIKLLEDIGDKPCLQIGDMGLGFGGVALPTLLPQHRFIRGNHDDPAACKQHINYAGEFGFWEEHNLFFLGGAWSIDYGWRQAWNKTRYEEWVRYKQNSSKPPQKVWWEDEELAQEELEKAIELYTTAKPELVATHEAPTSAARYILSDGFRPEKAACVNTCTSQALQKMLEAHQPKHWVFGHYHRDLDFTLLTNNAPNKTMFHCLNELTMRAFDGRS